MTKQNNEEKKEKDNYSLRNVIAKAQSLQFLGHFFATAVLPYESARDALDSSEKERYVPSNRATPPFFDSSKPNSNKDIQNIILDKNGELATFRVTDYMPPEERFPADSLGPVVKFNKSSSPIKYSGLDAGFGILRDTNSFSDFASRLKNMLYVGKENY